MSIPVSPAELPSVIAGRAAAPFLVSVGESGPKVVSVQVEVTGDVLVMAVGRGSLANVVARPTVTLLWPTDSGHPEHSLLVDGRAHAEAGRMVVTPTSAILHVSP